MFDKNPRVLFLKESLGALTQEEKDYLDERREQVKYHVCFGCSDPFCRRG